MEPGAPRLRPTLGLHRREQGEDLRFRVDIDPVNRGHVYDAFQQDRFVRADLVLENGLDQLLLLRGQAAHRPDSRRITCGRGHLLQGRRSDVGGPPIPFFLNDRDSALFRYPIAQDGLSAGRDVPKSTGKLEVLPRKFQICRGLLKRSHRRPWSGFRCFGVARAAWVPFNSLLSG